MKEIEIIIKNEYGLHARPASMLANCANQYKSEILINKDGKEVNAKSIMNLLLLAAGKDTVLMLSANGPDEEDALSALEDLIVKRKFDEE